MRGGSSTEPSASAGARRGVEPEGSGFVLVSVLWLLALLAAVAATFVTVTRLHVQAGTNASRNAEAELLADGAARLLAFGLATAAADGAGDLRADGVFFRCLLPSGAPVDAAIQDQGGLADLNAAPAGLIAWALGNAGIAPERAGRLAAAIVDFRDADDEAGPDGAERADYEAARLPLGPKNASFQSVSELDQVLGFDPATLGAVRGFFTVHSRSDGIDPSVTPRPAIAAPDEFVRPSRRRHFGIVAAAATADGGRFLRRALVEVLRQPDQPFRILEWGQVLGSEALPPPAEGGDAALPCVG